MAALREFLFSVQSVADQYTKPQKVGDSIACKTPSVGTESGPGLRPVGLGLTGTGPGALAPGLRRAHTLRLLQSPLTGDDRRPDAFFGSQSIQLAGGTSLCLEIPRRAVLARNDELSF